MDAALVLFARHGFAGTSIRMLAEEAGVSQGLLYNYYEGKEELLHAIFKRSIEEIQEDFADASEAPSPEEALTVLIRSAFDTVRARPDFWSLWYQLRAQPDVVAGLGERVGEWAETILANIEALLTGLGSPDPAVRARLVFATIDGAAQHYVLDPANYPLDRVGDELIELLARPNPPPHAEASP